MKTADENEKKVLEDQIIQLKRSADIASNVKLWSNFSRWLVGLVVFAFFVCVVGYFVGLGPDRYSSIEATRPILVFTLIVAMLGFGGLLIVRALYATEADDALQGRYRLAREVFLVFSGVFGTIIGFYFGASDREGVPTEPELSVAITEGRITAAVAQGTGPFFGLIEFENDGGRQMNVDGRVLSLDVRSNEFCPVGARLTVIDGRGQRAEAEIGRSAIDANQWPRCEATRPETNEAGMTEGNEVNGVDGNEIGA
ncbi:hypothetical protein RCO27_18520 [Sphingosinicella sp. LHD-64]|uniref:hypothetical protein n=1 Tax=Sphingosinicella sp. LHD-64 TaxID=3072139 RepID=UPI00280DF46A|nr:hypothetical protein [Sphingosinicella sp. LHD-64]MDQ8758227.1 hypothetical protein [Sphingosinicella sp. LHD-64]